MNEIGIIVSKEEEREAIVNIMTEVKVEQVYNLRFLTGKIRGKACVLVKSGVGKVNATRGVQIMIDKFHINYIVNIGSSISVNAMLDIGDIVIAKQVIQHDFDITAFGHSKGYITGVGDKITCNRELVNEIEQMIQAMPERSYQIKIGTVATGDIFCTEPWMKDKIRAKFDADVVDMECAAIAQVCYLDNIPFLGIKGITYIPKGGKASTSDENIKLTAKRCANLLKEFLD